MTEDAPLLAVTGLRLAFHAGGGLFRRGRTVQAVDDVSFAVRRGQTLGLVGESGSGKSSTARAVLGLYRGVTGRIVFEGQDLPGGLLKGRHGLHGQMQMVFQDPFSCLDPRMRIADIVAEPLNIGHTLHRAARRDRVAELLAMVGLQPELADRHPHALSGRQRQRVGIARALASSPSLIICDGAVSALDVSLQAQILALLADLQARLGIAYLFIAHDLGVVKRVSHEVAVMYRGRLVEQGVREALYRAPSHPYTQALFSAAPIPDPRIERARLRSRPPEPAAPASSEAWTGCLFAPRCRLATSLCRTERPETVAIDATHVVACHHWEEARATAGETATAMA